MMRRALSVLALLALGSRWLPDGRPGASKDRQHSDRSALRRSAGGDPGRARTDCGRRADAAVAQARRLRRRRIPRPDPSGSSATCTTARAVSTTPRRSTAHPRAQSRRPRDAQSLRRRLRDAESRRRGDRPVRQRAARHRLRPRPGLHALAQGRSAAVSQQMERSPTRSPTTPTSRTRSAEIYDDAPQSGRRAWILHARARHRSAVAHRAQRSRHSVLRSPRSRGGDEAFSRLPQRSTRSTTRARTIWRSRTSNPARTTKRSTSSFARITGARASGGDRELRIPRRSARRLEARGGVLRAGHLVGPYLPESYVDLGIDYEHNKLYPLAQAALLKGVAAAPYDGRIRYLLARAVRLAGREGARARPTPGRANRSIPTSPRSRKKSRCV